MSFLPELDNLSLDELTACWRALPIHRSMWSALCCAT
jgi:hypothetical protein